MKCAWIILSWVLFELTSAQVKHLQSIEKSPERQQEATCGLRNTKFRVVGGREATAGSWPWIVALGYKTVKGQPSFECGGVLINPLVVLTAAHCVLNKRNLYLVRGGDTDLLGDAVHSNYVEDVVIHDEYNPDTNENDIALLKLTFPENSTVICMPSAEKGHVNGSTAMWIAGWGAQKHGGVSSVRQLMEVKLNLVNTTVCKEAYRPFGNSAVIDERILCVGSKETRKDACQGDSGGPLMYEGDKGRFFVAGIISYGYKCADPSFPGVYTRFDAFGQWVTGHLTRLLSSSRKNVSRTRAQVDRAKIETYKEKMISNDTKNENLSKKTETESVLQPRSTNTISNEGAHIKSNQKNNESKAEDNHQPKNKEGEVILTPVPKVSAQNLKKTTQNHSSQNTPHADKKVNETNAKKEKPTQRTASKPPLICGKVDEPPVEGLRIVGGIKSTDGKTVNIMNTTEQKIWHHAITLVTLPPFVLFPSRQNPHVRITKLMKHILTAAHCLYGYEVEHVVVGASNLVKRGSHGSVIVPVRSQNIHENYNISTQANDIGILTLSFSVNFTDHIRAACLPFSEILAHKQPLMAVVAGWGADHTGGTTKTELHHVTVLILKPEDCYVYKKQDKLSFDERNICAGYITGKKDSCQGDSGSPLVQDYGDGAWYVMGIVSYGGKCGMAKRPGVYTRVTSYTDWIKTTILSSTKHARKL